MPFRRNLAVAALTAAWAISPSQSAIAQFEARSSLHVTGTTDPYSLVVGDFNRDGILDLAVVNTVQNTTGSVEIWLGKGDGTFRMGTASAIATEPFYGATGSLRNNGILDLVVAGGGSDDVYVLLGNGDGTFQAAVPYPASAESYMIGLGTFTASGNLDIVALGATNTNGNNCSCIEVLRGNGDGTFGAAITAPLPYGITAYSLTTGDFNNDGKLDVAVIGEGFPNYEVAILLGNGDGTFIAGGNYLLGAGGGSIFTGSFTSNKNKLDLAVTTGGSLAVLLGNGDGTFAQAVYYGAGTACWVTAQDFNGDGKLDLAAAGEGRGSRSQAGATVLSGNGNGTFNPGLFYPAGGQSCYLASGDFNGDHKPDLVVVDSVHGIITTLLNTGVLSLSPTTPLNFKKQAVGTTSQPQTVTLTNTGTTAVKIASMKASTEFGVTSSCGASVAAGAKCTITATFSPTKKGAVQGTITIIDSASSKPQVIEVLGTGT